MLLVIANPPRAHTLLVSAWLLVLAACGSKDLSREKASEVLLQPKGYFQGGGLMMNLELPQPLSVKCEEETQAITFGEQEMLPFLRCAQTMERLGLVSGCNGDAPLPCSELTFDKVREGSLWQVTFRKKTFGRDQCEILAQQAGPTEGELKWAKVGVVAVPYRFAGVTGIAEGADGTRIADFEYDFDLGRADLGAASGGCMLTWKIPPARRHRGRAMFRRYDDGWRVEKFEWDVKV